MDDEPDPPKRPRRIALDLLLVVGAMSALGGLLALGIMATVATWLGWSLVTLAQLLLALSLVARSRRR